MKSSNVRLLFGALGVLFLWVCLYHSPNYIILHFIPLLFRRYWTIFMFVGWESYNAALNHLVSLSLMILYSRFSIISYTFFSCQDPILQFLLSTVQDPKLSSVSALAIESLCMACHSQMTKYFDVLAQVTTSYDALFLKLFRDRTP